MRYLAMMLVTAIAIATLPPAHAQTYVINPAASLAGGWAGDGVGKDTLYQNGEDVNLRKLDSIQVFVETSDSAYIGILAAGVKLELDQTDAQLRADTVRVKTIALTKSGTRGVTWQDIRQAFVGPVPPVLRFYIYAEKDGTGRAATGGEAALVVKEYLR